MGSLFLAGDVGPRAFPSHPTSHLDDDREYQRASNESSLFLAAERKLCHSASRMPRYDESPGNGPTIPLWEELESRFDAKIVTYENDGQDLPGGMCGCCGSGPDVSPAWRAEPWYVYRAGICDSDGVYYSMLCEGCLEEIRDANARRPETERDEIARELTELLGDDLDGAQTMMDDLGLGE